MGFFLRAISVLNGAREWVSFAHEAFSWLGLAKRAAAVTAAGAAAIATPVVVMSKMHDPLATVAVQSPARTERDAIDQDVGGKIEKIDSDNIYSKLYLKQPEHGDLLKAIIAKCKETNELPAVQCDIAVLAKNELANRAYDNEMSRRSDEFNKRFRESLNSPSKDQRAANPTQIKMFAD